MLQFLVRWNLYNEWYATNLKMEISKTRVVIKYYQNKGKTHEETHKDKVKKLAKDSFSYATVKK